MTKPFPELRKSPIKFEFLVRVRVLLTTQTLLPCTPLRAPNLTAGEAREISNIVPKDFKLTSLPLARLPFPINDILEVS